MVRRSAGRGCDRGAVGRGGLSALKRLSVALVGVALVGVALGLAGCTTSDTDVRVGGGVETTVTVDVE